MCVRGTRERIGVRSGACYDIGYSSEDCGRASLITATSFVEPGVAARIGRLDW
jgi:hypothetical protein